MQLISENLRTALLEQFGEEKYNSHIYLAMYSFLKNMGLNNIAGKFKEQYEEESKHAEMIIEFLLDVNAPISLPQIQSCESPSTLPDIAKLYLERELYTTKSLSEIRNLAIDDTDVVCEEFMREMIKAQRVEYAEATDFFDKVEIIKDDWKAALLFDASIGGK